MQGNDLLDRVSRIYAAVGAVQESDISKFKPKVINDRSRVGYYQDWMGELNDADVANFAVSLITNIASLEYHLKKWADRQGYDKSIVDKAFANSQELKIIHDLWNNDKHGYPPRQPSKSGLSPRVDKFCRIVRMTTAAQKGSAIRLTFNKQGIPQTGGSGTATVIITGDILDKDDNRIDDFYSIALKAIEAWERVLNTFGIK
jgi:hypothetical protein